MGGGVVIIVDPNKVKTNLSKEDTIARLYEVLGLLEADELSVEPVDGDAE